MALTMLKKFVAQAAPAKDAAGAKLTRWILTTGAVDRDRDRINPDGVDLREFLQNPIALYAHDGSAESWPIGNWANVQRIGSSYGGRIEADLVLTAPGVTEVADTCRELIEAGVLRACSIGFWPEPGGYVQNEFGGHDFERVKLLECSVCAVPSNPQSLRVRALSSGAAPTLPGPAATPLVSFGELAAVLREAATDRERRRVLTPTEVRAAVAAETKRLVRREMYLHTGKLSYYDGPEAA